ncbi:hypothetical protein TNCV_568381 [Trichonephila clavipes]|nr:hypothetical protein TNCV_568381 [Trichonephila clavipes]
MRPHVAKTVKSYLDSQQVASSLACVNSPDMSPIEHEWDIVGRRIAHDLRPHCFDRRTLVAHTNNMEYSSADRY